MQFTSFKTLNNDFDNNQPQAQANTSGLHYVLSINQDEIEMTTLDSNNQSNDKTEGNNNKISVAPVVHVSQKNHEMMNLINDEQAKQANISSVPSTSRSAKAEEELTEIIDDVPTLPSTSGVVHKK